MDYKEMLGLTLHTSIESCIYLLICCCIGVLLYPRFVLLNFFLGVEDNCCT